MCTKVATASRESLNKGACGEGILHSLSTRKVHLRSALSSWALTHNLPMHTYHERPVALASYSGCGYCNEQKIMSNEAYENEDLNVLNFERIKWGGFASIGSSIVY